MYALIDPRTNSIHDVVETRFPVAAPLVWVEVPNDFDAQAHRFREGRVEPLPGPTFDQVKRAALDRITAARDSALNTLTVELDGATYDADEESAKRVSAALGAWERALRSGDPRTPSVVPWLDHDNINRELTVEKLAQLEALMWLAAESQVWARNAAAKVAIEAAETAEQIDAIEF